MRSIASIGASVIVAFLLCAGLLVLDSHAGQLGASAGGALAAGALAAFLITYDVLKREGIVAVPGGGKTDGRGRAPVRPSFDPDDVTMIEAVPRGGTEHMSRELANVNRGIVYIFRIILAPRVKYEHDALIEQLAVLSAQVSPKSYVYLVTTGGHFVWFTRAGRLKRYLEEASDGRALLLLINNGQEDQFASFTDLISFRVPRKTSSLKALRLLAAKGVPEGMIVHENRGTPIGPIDWGTLTLRVMPGEIEDETST